MQEHTQSKERDGRTELLAPAGGPEAGYAAVQAGADAVYLGLTRFSARAEAINFLPQELADFAGYAHGLGRRVYATVNTLVKTAELRELLDTLAVLSECRVDALIVQDLGVLRLIRRHFPHLAIHASTQLAVHNRAGAELLRELGVKRVTLARELTVDEIRDICSTGGIEVESFLHGALCYSYSGYCLFSALQRNGRSANRGRCAYPCRDLFTRCANEASEPCAQAVEPPEESHTDTQATAEQGHIFSLKDLALPQHLRELGEAGVASLKIEGRKKSPLYVSTVVSMYRRLLDGGGIDETFEQDRQRVQTVFSRPWTDFFAGDEGRRQAIDAQIVGHRGAVTGEVETVRTVNGERRLRFTTALALERHDGLQADLPGQSRPYGFAVTELYRVEDSYTPRIYEAEAGMRVEVPLPPLAPHLPAGTVLYRSSSQEVKREVRVLTPKPGSCAPRVPVRVRLRIDAQVALAEASFVPDTAAAVALPAGIEPNDEAVAIRLEGEWGAARNAGVGEDAARQVFDKTGDTPYALAEFVYENPQDRFVPVSRLNALRRDLYALLQERQNAARHDWLESLAAETEGTEDSAPATTAPTHSPTPATSAGAECDSSAKAVAAASAAGTAPGSGAADLRWSIKIAHPRQLGAFSMGELATFEEIVLDLGECLGGQPEEFLRAAELSALALGPQRIRLSLPVILRAPDLAALQPLLGEFRRMGFTRFEAGNLGGLRLARALGGGDVSADWPLYVLNPEAAAFLEELHLTRFCCSPEDDGANLRALLAGCGRRRDGAGRPLTQSACVVAYQDVPLFTGEACARSALTGCRGDGQACARQPLTVQDSFGASYLLLSRGCRTTLISARPLCLAGRLAELTACGVRHARVDFLHRPYTPEEVTRITATVQAGRMPEGTREGNYAGALQ